LPFCRVEEFWKFEGTLQLHEDNVAAECPKSP
jgi:hypothetical protein